MNLGRVFKVIVLTGIIGYFGFVMYLFFASDIANYQDRIAFDSVQWKNWVETELTISLRWDMTHDLTKNHRLIGKTVDELVDLLGPPDRKSVNEISYYLGMARHGIDTGALNFEIENGVVVKFRIWHG